MGAESPRPAFYALAEGGWRDYVTLLHLPYTAWHLSYVAIGSALAPEFALGRLLPTLAAFFLAVGIGAHALDELAGRPLRTRIPTPALVALSAASLLVAVAIGVFGAVTVEPWIGAFVAAGAFMVLAYNLELLGGRFHGDLPFALSWGAFPLLTGYFAAAERIDHVAVLAAAFAFAFSLAQRRLSTQVRDVRRRVVRVEGVVERRDGSVGTLDAGDLMRVEEAALRALTAAVTALATALVAFRLA